MKKIIVVLLVGVIATMFIGCGNIEETECVEETYTDVELTNDELEDLYESIEQNVDDLYVEAIKEMVGDTMDLDNATYDLDTDGILIDDGNSWKYIDWASIDAYVDNKYVEHIQ